MRSGSGWRSLRTGKGLDEVGKREPLKQCEGKTDCKGNRKCGRRERQSMRKLLHKRQKLSSHSVHFQTQEWDRGGMFGHLRRKINRFGILTAREVYRREELRKTPEFQICLKGGQRKDTFHVNLVLEKNDYMNYWAY